MLLIIMSQVHLANSLPPTQLINRTLLARIEVLEAKNTQLKTEIQQRSKSQFRLEDVEDDDKLFHFYTGFISFSVFLAFFELLGPVVEKLNYWGSKEGERQRHRTRKLDSKNQLFLTLIKLRLNLKLTDLAFRFKISPSQASRYWVCFLYNHLREIEWMPAVDKILGTQPSSFRRNFRIHMLLLMGARFLFRHLLIYTCNLPPGASTSTTIPW